MSDVLQISSRRLADVFQTYVCWHIIRFTLKLNSTNSSFICILVYGSPYLFFFQVVTSLSQVSDPERQEWNEPFRLIFPGSGLPSALFWSVRLVGKKPDIDCELRRDRLALELLDGLCSCNFSDGRISFTPERDVYFRMCENKALEAAERGRRRMPLRPASRPSSFPSGLTPCAPDPRPSHLSHSRPQRKASSRVLQLSEPDSPAIKRPAFWSMYFAGFAVMVVHSWVQVFEQTSNT